MTETPEKVFTTDGAKGLLSDSDLVEELRARGYTVTASKTVTVEL